MHGESVSGLLTQIRITNDIGFDSSQSPSQASPERNAMDARVKLSSPEISIARFLRWHMNFGHVFLTACLLI